MRKPCPSCGSVETGPSFTFKWEQTKTEVIATDPYYGCSECGHSWQIKGRLVLSRHSDSADKAAAESFAKHLTDSD
jgi:DNA-directed RNA polymerase subunit RPC12/RpoP